MFTWEECVLVSLVSLLLKSSTFLVGLVWLYPSLKAETHCHRRTVHFSFQFCPFLLYIFQGSAVKRFIIITSSCYTKAYIVSTYQYNQYIINIQCPPSLSLMNFLMLLDNNIATSALLWVPFSMEYHFPSFYLQPLCVLTSKAWCVTLQCLPRACRPTEPTHSRTRAWQQEEKLVCRKPGPRCRNKDPAQPKAARRHSS